MKSIVQRWLAYELAGLDSVRACYLNRGADISVYTWSTTVVQVYLFDALPKTRTIKKLVSDNTRVGVGSMLLLEQALLPNDGDRVNLSEPLQALHALYKDKVYAYDVANGQPRISQVHFKSFGRGDEVEAWYGPDVPVRHLPSFRVWVKAPNAIKGDYLIASFGSEAFWKTGDYQAGRDAFRQQQRTGGTYRATYSSASWQGGARYTRQETPEDLPNGNGYQRVYTGRPPASARLQSSYAELGVALSASADEVKAAFRKLARELHPDVSALPKAEAERRFKALNEAYTFIKITNKWS